eukprot:GFUD01002915.1.p1 GENE.GFUD01002915.1~~GFUD01002915.1.p1  ORF type:complete len:219 (-),score=84.73 GFUD01002915.1:62-667(-)
MESQMTMKVATKGEAILPTHISTSPKVKVRSSSSTLCVSMSLLLLSVVGLALVYQNIQLDRQSRCLRFVVGRMVVIMGRMDSKIAEVEMDVEMFMEDQEELVMIYEDDVVIGEATPANMDFLEFVKYEVADTDEKESTEDEESLSSNIEAKIVININDETEQKSEEDYEKYLEKSREEKSKTVKPVKVAKKVEEAEILGFF